MGEDYNSPDKNVIQEFSRGSERGGFGGGKDSKADGAEEHARDLKGKEALTERI